MAIPNSSAEVAGGSIREIRLFKLLLSMSTNSKIMAK